MEGGAMHGGQSEVRERHARLQEDAAKLFHALDEEDSSQASVAFGRFVDDIEAHLCIDLAVGYQLLMHHPSESVRRVAERVLIERQRFPEEFEALVSRWGEADSALLLTQAFRDELESLVSSLLKRIRIEQRLLAALSSVA
jgi:hypothetical protein